MKNPIQFIEKKEFDDTQVSFDNISLLEDLSGNEWWFKFTEEFIFIKYEGDKKILRDIKVIYINRETFIVNTGFFKIASDFDLYYQIRSLITNNFSEKVWSVLLILLVKSRTGEKGVFSLEF